MTPEEFMRDHAAKASSGRIPEILGDLTPAAMGQLGPLMAGGPNPPTANSVSVLGDDGTDYVFDVTVHGRRRCESVDARDGATGRRHMEDRQARSTRLGGT
ncbi:MAG: hypothetical protein M3P30_11250 [Chloroflexota bacterium]|nr:hypothetical protein [Chloroflexota bacterium]